ncbi:hypothetical protein B0H16DRAFT_530991 [Mycena metata]|uniref:Gfd2/YDR514C-like C-terminal domain-containing protein n=1 Tax=Mycena metata TaxID=1033252 RepID=A0AAD7H7T6_9AGAR|nr:hypothetical protein B0H16DRAFT_530991 [Mycena metata]
MSDFTLVDPRGWEYDLHSVYSAYTGYFQLHNIPWYDRSWGPLFSTFEDFLAFSWPVITVTDVWTGRAHIVTRLTSIGAFLKMIKTRFGETLPQAPNILQVSPFETTTRHLRTVSDYASYKKLHSTLPAAVLSALKLRVRAGEPKAIRELWAARDRTFLAIDFEWSERNEKSCLEWGYAAVRCGHLEALGHWPPVPDANYRKGHYIVAEYVDKVVNKHCPTHPWEYAFGESHVCPKAKLPQIIQAMISSLASPDSETIPNTLVLVAHGISGDLARMEEMRIKLPHNMLILDTASFERSLFAAGHRPAMVDPHTSSPGNPKARTHGSMLSLENVLRSLPAPAASPSGSGSGSPGLGKTPPMQIQIPIPPQQLLQAPTVHGVFPQQGALVPGVTLHNAGNDAFLGLYALQLLLEPTGTQAPVPLTANMRGGGGGARPVSGYGMNGAPFVGGSSMFMPGYGDRLSGDFAQMQLGVQPPPFVRQTSGSRSPGPEKAARPVSMLRSPSKGDVVGGAIGGGGGGGHGSGNPWGGTGTWNGNGATRGYRRLSAVPGKG